VWSVSVWSASVWWCVAGGAYVSVECVSVECGVCRVCAEMWRGRHITLKVNPIHMY